VELGGFNRRTKNHKYLLLFTLNEAQLHGDYFGGIESCSLVFLCMIKTKEHICLGIVMSNPRIFIGSSSESLKVAGACNVALDHAAEVSVWPHIFETPNDSTLSSLINKSKAVDFALFIFHPNDLTLMRGEEKATIRDNVLFELGLFIGALGKDRCFILRPRGIEMHIPSDLIGLNNYDYDPKREDDLLSAVSAPCFRIQTSMSKTGVINKTIKEYSGSHNIPTLKKEEFELDDASLMLLAWFLGVENENAAGATIYDAMQNNSYTSQESLNISVVKMNRCGFLSKSLEEYEHGGSSYFFKITNSGIEVVLDNESRIRGIKEQQRFIPQGFFTNTGQ
jgi:hypothetical protein